MTRFFILNYVTRNTRYILHYYTQTLLIKFMRPLSELTARVANRNFSRKYIALGRIVEHWNDIMGKEFSDVAQPVKINYRKAPKNKKATATLEIATSSSYATILPYQKGIILERINKIFGDKWITDIRFVAGNIEYTPEIKKKINSPLTQEEKKYLSGVLDQIDDIEFKEKLENLGKAILKEDKQ